MSQDPRRWISAPRLPAARWATPAALAACCACSAIGAPGCEEWAPPKPPAVAEIPAHPGGSARAGKGAAAEKSPFAALADAIIDRWLIDDPSMGRYLGLHQFDGKVADYSAAALAARLARVEGYRDKLAAVDKSKLTADEALDLAILSQRVELTIFQMKELETYRRTPMVYEDLFAVNGYLDRDYAPITERAEHLLAHEEAALAQVPNIRKNLRFPLSRPVCQTAIKVYKGFAEYLRSDVVKQLKGVGSADFQARLQKTNEALAQAASDLTAHFKDELKRADDSYALGPARYQKLLLVQEGLNISLAELKKMGEENLAENKKAYEALVRKKVKLTRLDQSAVLGEAERQTEAARRFIIDKKLVTIPSEDKAIVKETPPFMRWNQAFLDMPGAFEQKAKEGFYYISPPDPSWTKKEQEEYLPPRGILLATTVHEVYPGHFLQGQWYRRAPTRAQKIFASYSFVEGWAHYGEQMMIEEGFGAETEESRLGQLSDALLRNCRVVASLGLHTEKMTLAQAERRFMQDCKQGKAVAREQAARGAFDPGYFAYTLGKIQILALRAEAKKKLGSKFSLQRFHDALLSHGAPPVPLIRDRVLKEIE